MPATFAEWLNLLTLLVLLFTLAAVVWYSWETRGMRHEMQLSRRLTGDQLAVLKEDYERRYDAHVTVVNWDVVSATVTLANAGPGPVVSVTLSVRIGASGQQLNERCYVGAEGAIAVGSSIEVLLVEELHPGEDFPPSEGHRLTVEMIATTALGESMPAKLVHPPIRDEVSG